MHPTQQVARNLPTESVLARYRKPLINVIAWLGSSDGFYEAVKFARARGSMLVNMDVNRRTRLVGVICPAHQPVARCPHAPHRQSALREDRRHRTAEGLVRRKHIVREGSERLLRQD